jgi:hypothetical protein
LGNNYIDNDFDEKPNKINFIWYLLMKSADLFFEKHGRYPGEKSNSSIEDKFEADVPLLIEVYNEYLTLNNKKEKLPFNINEEFVNFNDYVYEFCRFSNSKIAPAISIISSIVSQEVIKMITYQFRTIDNTLIFDGVNSTISTFKF